MFAKSLIIAAAFIAAVSARACTDAESSALTLKLTPIATKPELQPVLKDCETTSGFKLIPPSGLPNDATTIKMCNAPSCVTLINTIKGLSPTDCDFTVFGVTFNVYTLTSEFDGKCKALTTPATTAPVPVVTTAAPVPGVTTAAPVPGVTTAAPVPGVTTAAPPAAC